LGERSTTGVLVQDMMDRNEGTLPNPGDLAVGKHQEAIANMNQCVIGMLEEWEVSQKMIKYWFPWMKILGLPSTTTTTSSAPLSPQESRAEEGAATSPHLMKLYTDKETAATIEPQVRDLIEELIPCDMKLYRNMQLRFEKQKKFLAIKSVIL
jgi:hypothetical protein